MPYGAPPPPDGNPYSAGNPYGAPPPPPVGQPGYGYPSAPPPPQPPYGAQPPGGYDYGGGYGGAGGYGGDGYGYPPMDGPACRFCGGMPAVETTVRGHQGLILAYRMLRMSGPFCRTCGTATVRDMSSRTLVQGWWSPVSVVMAPITLLMNLFSNSKINKLPPPAPGTHGPQLDPGVPLGRRPSIAMLILPVSLVVTVLLAATGALGPTGKDNPAPFAVTTPTTTPFTFTPKPLPSPTWTYTPPPLPTFTPTPTPTPKDSVDDAKVGDCLRNENGTSETTDTHPKVTMLPCSDPKAQYKVVYKYPATSDEKVCEKQSKADSWYTSKHPNWPALDYVLCLKQIS